MLIMKTWKENFGTEDGVRLIIVNRREWLQSRIKFFAVCSVSSSEGQGRFIAAEKTNRCDKSGDRAPAFSATFLRRLSPTVKSASTFPCPR